MMSHLKQATLVACPISQAKHRMLQYLKRNGSADGRTLELSLGFSFRAPKTTASLKASVEVRLTLVEGTPENAEASYKIDWRSPEGGFYPVFSGDLTVRNEDFDSFWLDLAGTYELPPAAIGGRIAADTARKLLARIASAIEVAYLIDESKRLGNGTTR